MLHFVECCSASACNQQIFFRQCSTLHQYPSQKMKWTKWEQKQEVVTYWPNRNSVALTPNSQPSISTSIVGTLKQGAITSQGPSELVAFSRSIKNPNPTAGMFLAPNHNNQIHDICSVRFEANLQLCKYMK